MPNRVATVASLDHVHCRAICDEIGERLRSFLDREASDMPPRLLMLLNQLAQSDCGPSIVPTIDEMSFPLGSELFSAVKQSADQKRPATNRKLAFVGP
jgi:hypothetical protein